MKNGKIGLEGLRFFAFHGCYPGEREQGNWFEVDVILHAPILSPAQSDDLLQACDYSDVYRIVREEMSVQRYLLESLVLRMAHRILSEHISIETIDIKLSKLNPPVAGEVKAASVAISLERKDLNAISFGNSNL
jgi:dihydroneopterin aldolase